MKKTVMGVIAVLILGALPLACGGSNSGTQDPAEPSGVEALCQKLDQCMLNPDTTVQECIATNNQLLQALRNFPECAPVVGADEDTYACVSALSCTEVQTFLLDQDNHTCRQQADSMLSMADKQSCDTAIQNAHGGQPQ